ncbi:hypothetical protein RQP46_001811 [Phenoliferia psychrophenolica]
MTDAVESVKTIFNPKTLIKRGFAPVSTKRPPQALNLYYELHGDPSPSATKLVFVMGEHILSLLLSAFAWHKQVSHFAKDGMGYQVLVFDNRGVGNSSSPGGRYKTSAMAADIVDLLDYVGWTGKRELHVVGVSMGGMIVQELALAIPDRIASLILTSTKCGDRAELPSRAMLGRVGFFLRLATNTAGTPEQIISLVTDTLFPREYLDAPDPSNGGKPNRVAVEEDFKRRVEVNKLQTTPGKIGQMAAVLGHRVPAAKLKLISESIPKVAIIVGDKDELIDPQRGHELHEMLPGSEFKLVEGGGHALLSQICDEYNSWIEHVVADAKEHVAAEGKA